MRNCTKRKSEYRICEKLSNGQLLNLYFWRIKSTEVNFFIWKVGLCICNNRRSANQWISKAKSKLNNKQTGKCGLEGLAKACHYIVEFRSNLPMNAEIQFKWTNDKRKRAYRYIKQYGFQLNEELGVYTSRNLDYWTLL